MFWTFVSPKGGVGVSILAAAVASELSKHQRVTLVDFGGDQADIFGLDRPRGSAPGLAEWFDADTSVGVEALSNLEVEVTPTLRLIPAGLRPVGGDLAPERCAQLVADLGGTGTVLADVGVIGADVFAGSSVVVAASDRSTLVVRSCYLTLRRAQRLPLVFDDVVEIVEGGRALQTLDIEAALGRPVTSRTPIDPAVARAVDAGLFPRRIPRQLRRVVRDLATPTLDLVR